MPTARVLVPFFLLLGACESGTATVVTVDVDDQIAEALTPLAPGVLVTDGGASAPGAPLAALCGSSFGEPVTYSFDFGFGCLDERTGPAKETVRAWVAPMPDGWDADAFCALEPTPFDGLTIGPDVTGGRDTDDTAGPADTAEAADTAETADTGADGHGPEARLAALGLASEPDPTWPLGVTQATWTRDVSPCGGVLRAQLLIGP